MSVEPSAGRDCAALSPDLPLHSGSNKCCKVVKRNNRIFTEKCFVEYEVIENDRGVWFRFRDGVKIIYVFKQPSHTAPKKRFLVYSE